VLAPFVEVACRQAQRKIEYVVTFQGYELYLNYARRIGCEQTIHGVFRDMVDGSGYKAVAVSEDYKQRVMADVGVASERIAAIPACVPMPEPVDRETAHQRVGDKARQHNRPVDATAPLVTYLGRQDSEKGLDLLFYAIALLRHQGEHVQVVIAGPTLFDGRYEMVCKQIARNLRLELIHWRRVSETHRRDLMAASRCVVYPSIHREPFGMVPVEAVSQGTPAIVPDYGGVAKVIESPGRVAGLRFRVWDSGSLASTIQTLLNDPALWRRLSDDGPDVAAHYSVANLAHRVLQHLGLGTACAKQDAKPDASPAHSEG